MKHVAASNLEAQLFGLSTLVQLGKRARHVATAQELSFVMVNETNALVPYRQAVLWRREASGRGGVVAISGSAAVERNAPITHWLNRVLARLDSDTTEAPRPVGAADLPAALGEEWAEWLPAHALWVPLALDPAHVLGGLLLAREQPWSDGERHIISELADSFAHAWVGFLGGRRRSLLARLWGGRKYLRIAVAAAVIGAMFLPISLSALAPAEVVPFRPTIVRAPLEGVVDHFAVAPNAPVKEGQTLLELDPRAIQNKLEVAGKALAVAEAEYRQAAQEALFDEKSRAKLTVLKARADQRRTDVAYAQSLLDRIHVNASRDGLALFEDPNDWIGRPVTIGERLLEIADPTQGELEIWLPIADAITLKPGAEVEFFLNIAPGSPCTRRCARPATRQACRPPISWATGSRPHSTIPRECRASGSGVRRKSTASR